MQVSQVAKTFLATWPKLAIEIHTAQLPANEHTYRDVFELLDLTGLQCHDYGARRV